MVIIVRPDGFINWARRDVIRGLWKYYYYFFFFMSHAYAPMNFGKITIIIDPSRRSKN